MMMKFTETHEWIDDKNGIGTVGVTNHAQDQLGDIVYVELPKVGKVVKVGEEVAVLESTKAAADVYAPVSGEIVEVNQVLTNTPELVNRSPEKEGWLFKIKMSNKDEVKSLLDSQTYLSKLPKS
jgi:glycine cleavage system H protein